MIRMSMNRFVAMVFVGVGLVGCGSKTISECSADSDCTNLAYPFCDVNGEFSISGGVKNVCTIIPPDCSVERCGCSPGATTCAGDQETTCNAGGKSTTTDTCALGCASTKDRCLSFTPLNGLGPALNAAATEPDIAITAGSTIDTDTGYVRNSANAKINVATLVVTGPTDIRVFLGGSFDIDDVVITGTKAVAFVSPRTVTIRGMIDASANKNGSGPGGSATGCVGQTATDTNTNTVGGGGGHATVGGAGVENQNFTQGEGVVVSAVGGGVVTGSQLVGGCIGGGGANAGGGGGAIQIVSLTKIEFTSAPKLGFVDVGGGGAKQATQFASGGGAGGLVVLEAPEVSLGGVTANGGSGNSCGVDGNDSTPSLAFAAGGSSTCTTLAPSPGGGSGGTIDHLPGSGSGTGGGGGGGGGVGVLFVNTIDGKYVSAANPIMSAYVTVGSIMPI